jgi:hypothetical protein
MIYVFTLIAALVEAISVAFMVNALGSMTAASGALTGFMLWLGFVAPTNLVNKLFAGQGFKVGDRGRKSSAQPPAVWRDPGGVALSLIRPYRSVRSVPEGRWRGEASRV